MPEFNWWEVGVMVNLIALNLAAMFLMRDV